MLRLLIGAVVIAFSMGCRVCQTCDQYPAFGGSWQRTNPVSGRVGSIFDPAGAKVGGVASSQPITNEPWDDESPGDDEGSENEPESRSLLEDLENSLREEAAERQSNSESPEPELIPPEADLQGT